MSEQKLTIPSSDLLQPQCCLAENCETLFLPRYPGQGYCSAPCWHRTRARLLTMTPDKFWCLVQNCSHGDHCKDCCWPWQGRRDKDGYGVYGGAKNKKAHRYALEYLQSPLPVGLLACHTCDNPPCCNPAHLWPGTNHDNTIDAQHKGRLRGLRGEASPRSKLHEQDVRHIHVAYRQGTSQAALATTYGVKQGTIHDVLHGKNWASIAAEYPPLAPERRQHRSHGDGHGMAKLTAAEVYVIRSLPSRPNLKHELAEAYGVTPQAIHAIRQRKTWKHLPELDPT